MTSAAMENRDSSSEPGARKTNVRTFIGHALPPHDWYSDPELRSSLSTTLPPTSVQPPSEGQQRYTHSLIFLFHPSPPSSLLLGLKKKGFGKGTYNGIGGKLLASETARGSVIRETSEEIHVPLSAEQVEFIGKVKIDVEEGEKVSMAVYWGELNKEQIGQVRESEEIKPDFHDVEGMGGKLPWESMRPEHKIYFGTLLQEQAERGKKDAQLFELEVKFDKEPRKDELEDGERPENHRIVRAWRLDVYRNECDR